MEEVLKEDASEISLEAEVPVMLANIDCGQILDWTDGELAEASQAAGTEASSSISFDAMPEAVTSTAAASSQSSTVKSGSRRMFKLLVVLNE